MQTSCFPCLTLLRRHVFFTLLHFICPFKTGKQAVQHFMIMLCIIINYLIPKCNEYSLIAKRSILSASDGCITTSKYFCLSKALILLRILEENKMEQIQYVTCQFHSSTYDMDIILFHWLAIGHWLAIFIMEEYCYYHGDYFKNDRKKP